jgi:hypothetical protein
VALVAVLVGLIAAASFYLSADEPTGMSAIYEGHHFSTTEIAGICKALETEELAWRVNDRRVEVRRDRLADAQSLLDRRGLGPPGFRGTREQPLTPAIWALPGEREAIERRQRERELQAAIEQYDPSLQATVQIARTGPRSTRKTAEELRVTVLLKCEGDRRIRPAAADAIATLLFSLVPDLKPEGLWILDSKSRVYHSPAHTGLDPHSIARTREEELTERIFEQLDYIKDIRVSVSIGVPVSPSRPPAPASPQVIPNRPIEDPPTSAGPATAGRAKVFVQVPAAYVLERRRAVSSNPRPAPGELERLFRETRDKVETVVRNVVPTNELETVDIVRIEVAGAPVEAVPVPDPLAQRVRLVWIAAACGLGAVTCLAVGALSVRLATRRAPARARGVVPGPRLMASGSASPSERVRELVRLDPTAAAGVLQRWIGHGGHL